ncbi:MAG: hypothetical protein ACI9BD_000114 [Candidatus Marinamargulisbacteria bacterium]
MKTESKTLPKNKGYEMKIHVRLPETFPPRDNRNSRETTPTSRQIDDQLTIEVAKDTKLSKLLPHLSVEGRKLYVQGTKLQTQIVRKMSTVTPKFETTASSPSEAAGIPSNPIHADSALYQRLFDDNLSLRSIKVKLGDKTKLDGSPAQILRLAREVILIDQNFQNIP